MGSCVSVHKTSDSAMKFRYSIGTNAKKVIIPSPADEKPTNGENPVAGFGSPCKKPGLSSGFDSLSPLSSRRDFGSKEETFFDTRAWLDSDCEDDFYSINGDFTPSRGNTPNYQRSTPTTPRLNKVSFLERAPNSKLPELSPTVKKKKLAELFEESTKGERDSDTKTNSTEQNVINGKMETENAHLQIPPKSSEGTPYLTGTNSVCSSERTPNGESKPEREKKVRAAQCCLPSLVPSLSFSEKKKQPSPVSHNGG
ncbi:uncharacterized protein At3g27210-like [Magnolia sinica]|uniref:uncharacterized protein At3g27210-like n=1 Tax=Magnolia sinica TaxID=86752 RepID=UPI002657BF0D|nr:uncharacterized protein At3g27210-like [Magnolia sinica]